MVSMTKHLGFRREVAGNSGMKSLVLGSSI